MPEGLSDIPERFNLARALVDAHVAAGRGARPAIRCEGKTLTYADAAAMVGRVGNALRTLGVEVEDRVAIVLPDSPEFVAAFMGAVKIGAIAVPISDLFGPDEYRFILRDSRAKAVVAAASVVDKVVPKDDEGRRYLKHVLVVGGEPADARGVRGAGAGAPERAAPPINWERLVAEASPDCEAEPTSRDDMAFWQYSSGSTGVPKGVVHLHQDMVHIAAAYGRHVIGITAADRILSVAKLYFSYGCGNSLMHPLAVGATAILHPGRVEPATIFELIAKERPTLFFSVPTHYAAMLASPGAREADLSSVRLCLSAGEALPAPIFERWKARFGHEILDGIGSTEVGHIFISNRQGDARAGCSGTVVPGYEARVADEDGAPLPAGEVGELWVKGNSTAAFYWNDRARTRHAFRGDWFATGDRYAVDETGHYTYQGRSDDIIRAGAMWISPMEVEAALLAHPAVLEAAVVGRRDEDGLTRVSAFVVPRKGHRGGPVLSAELIAFARDRLAHYKAPRWIEFTDTLPKTGTGKIQRFKLRA